MGKRAFADLLAESDPSHVKHYRSVWDIGDVARICGFQKHVVSKWLRLKFLSPTDVVGTASRMRPKFTPASVLAGTVVTTRRMPKKALPKANLLDGLDLPPEAEQHGKGEGIEPSLLVPEVDRLPAILETVQDIQQDIRRLRQPVQVMSVAEVCKAIKIGSSQLVKLDSSRTFTDARPVSWRIPGRSRLYYQDEVSIYRLEGPEGLKRFRSAHGRD